MGSLKSTMRTYRSLSLHSFIVLYLISAASSSSVNQDQYKRGFCERISRQTAELVGTGRYSKRERADHALTVRSFSATWSTWTRSWRRTGHWRWRPGAGGE